MSIDDDTEAETYERVTEALENTIVACGFGLVCAVGRLFGLTSGALYEVFEGMEHEVDELVDLMEKGTGQLKKPPLKVVPSPPTTDGSSATTKPPTEET